VAPSVLGTSNGAWGHKPLVGGSFTCYPQSMKLISLLSTELIEYVVTFMYSTFWPCVIKSCSKFAVDPTYRSRVGVTTMSHWLPAPICMLFKGKGVKFRLSIPPSLPQKGTTLTRTCHTANVLSVRYIQRCDLWPGWKDQKSTFLHQTGHLHRPPTSTWPPEIVHAGSCVGGSYISSFMKSGPGVSELWGGGSKIALSYW